MQSNWPLRYLLIAGLVFAVFVFRKGLFVKEIRSNGDLGGADVGLLQLNSSIVTGAKNTGALAHIFNKKDYILLSFSDLLAEVLDQNSYRRAQKYLVLLNAAENNSRLLQDINPLRNAVVKFVAGNGKVKHKHIQFRFRREISEGKVSRVLVYIKDARKIDHGAKKQTKENFAGKRVKLERPKRSSSTGKYNKPLVASKAKKEGLVQIADIFAETADQEKEHAKRFFSFLEGGVVEITAAFPAGVVGTTVLHTCFGYGHFIAEKTSGYGWWDSAEIVGVTPWGRSLVLDTGLPNEDRRSSRADDLYGRQHE